MKTPYDIIIKPYITERSTEDMAEGKYTFIVDTNSTKTEVRKAVEELFSVKVLKVSTMNYAGKIKRMGAHTGPRSKWKKAIIRIDLEPKAPVYMEKGGKKVASGKKYKSSIEEFGSTQ